MSVLSLIVIDAAYNYSRIHHKEIRTVSQNKRTPVETILLLFVESGAVLGVVQVRVFLYHFASRILNITTYSDKITKAAGNHLSGIGCPCSYTGPH